MVGVSQMMGRGGGRESGDTFDDEWNETAQVGLDENHRVSDGHIFLTELSGGRLSLPF